MGPCILGATGTFCLAFHLLPQMILVPQMVLFWFGLHEPAPIILIVKSILSLSQNT